QGDHLDQKTFHEHYEVMPEGFHAELIGGVVFVPSPVSPHHSLMHTRVLGWLTPYELATSGVLVLTGGSVILGPESEPQPDVAMIVEPERGGQMRLDDEGYYAGAPELVVEVASSTESIEMHLKRRDYERAGVREYVVILLRQERVAWFLRRESVFVEVLP